MTNIEDKLSNRPRAHLSKAVDSKLKIKLFGGIARNEMSRVSSYYYFRRRVLVSASITTFMILIVTTPGYAYASKSVTVGHFLFPVKKAIEDFEYNVSADRSATLLKFSLRRIEEAELLAGDSEQEENITILMNEARRLKEDAGLHEDKPSSEVITEYQERGDMAIKQVAEKIGVESGDAVTDAVALTIEDVKKSEVNTQKPEEKKETDKVAPTQTPISKPKTQTTPSVQKPKTNVVKPTSPATIKKETEIVNLKNDVKKMETSLVNDDYKKEEVEKIVEKINNRIEKAEKEENSQKSEQIIKPTKALTNNAEYFVKKEVKGSVEKGNKK